MQTGMSEVRDDKAGSNFFSASQYSRIFHNVAVENINIYVSMKSINMLLTNNYLRDGTWPSIFLLMLTEEQ